MNMYHSGLKAVHRFEITEAGWHVLCGEYLQNIPLCLELAKKQAIGGRNLASIQVSMF